LSPTPTLILYCLAIVAVSLIGGALPMLVRLTHRRMEVALSFISGVMLGVAALVLLPHAFEMRLVATQVQVGHGSNAHSLGHDLITPVMLWLLAGFLAMFFIERFFCFHHHDAPEPNGVETSHACVHDHSDHTHDHSASPHALRWSGAAIGLTLHSLLDGVALAASVSVAHDDRAGPVAGLGTFLVVLLHKPFDSLTLGTLMAAGRQSAARRHIVNLGFALLVPVGAALFMVGLAAGEGGGLQSTLLSAALAFAAGTFLCIALSDLLPELQFHQHDRIKLSLALVLGLAVAWGVAELEARTHGDDDRAGIESPP